MKASEVLAKLKQVFPDEPDYHQAVEEVLLTIEEEYNRHPEFEKHNLVERLCIPDRIITFRVTWMDDKGNTQVNVGYRVQHNMAIGPYKGGIRFHPTVNIGVMKFLAFEQTFKNALTTLPMGGGKGGSNFDPKGKSDAEIMRFCQAFMLELTRLIGPNTDVPAGDIGVAGREVGYMFGMYKKLRNEFTGVFTGKGIEWGGSLARPEATGFGCVYFCQNMMKTRGADLKGKTVAISGFGNVAWGTVQKLSHLGAKPVTISGPDGYIYDPDGITTKEKFDYMVELRSSNQDIVAPYAQRFPNAKFFVGKRPWEQKVDVAIPCATQNELNEDDAKRLVSNGLFCLTEAANMPCTPEAVEVFQSSGILYAPGKAANAGGVATSGLEMSQNSMRYNWTFDEVDARLQQIMKDIHDTCLRYGKKADGSIDYVKGANIGGFMKVARAMIAQGSI